MARLRYKNSSRMEAQPKRLRMRCRRGTTVFIYGGNRPSKRRILNWRVCVGKINQKTPEIFGKRRQIGITLQWGKGRFYRDKLVASKSSLGPLGIAHPHISIRDDEIYQLASQHESDLVDYRMLSALGGWGNDTISTLIIASLRISASHW